MIVCGVLCVGWWLMLGGCRLSVGGCCMVCVVYSALSVVWLVDVGWCLLVVVCCGLCGACNVLVVVCCVSCVVR